MAAEDGNCSILDGMPVKQKTVKTREVYFAVRDGQKMMFLVGTHPESE
jgi:hypothetical protein